MIRGSVPALAGPCQEAKKRGASGSPFSIAADYALYLRITRVALVPPNPKLLDMTVVS